MVAACLGLLAGFTVAWNLNKDAFLRHFARLSISEPVSLCLPAFAALFRGRQSRNAAASTHSINCEIAVQREDYAPRPLFGHANDARVGKGHGNISVPLQ